MRSTTTNDYEVQARQEMLYPGNRTVAVITAVAANVAGYKVGLYLRPSGVEVRVASTVVDLSSGPIPVGNGGTVALVGEAIEVTWPDGSDLVAKPNLGWGLDVAMVVPSTRQGAIEGVLGNFNGDPADDITPHGGAPISQPPTFASLYPAFADSWRVSDPMTGGFDSLFDYGPGESTATFTDKTIPDAPATASGLSEAAYAAAEAICRDAGVYDPVTLEACILDVALSGQVVFATSAAESQILTGTTLSIDQPGGTASLIFSASAGEEIFVDVPFSSFPDVQCPSLTLTDLSQNLDIGGKTCMVEGQRYIERRPLSSTGRYSLGLSATQGGTGAVRLVIYKRHMDQRSAITINGPPVTAFINQPGSIAALSFAGTANQVVSVDILNHTLAIDDCGPTPLQLLAPNGTVLATAPCIYVGTDKISGTTLPDTGQYTLRVDPTGPLTGQVTLQLHD